MKKFFLILALFSGYFLANCQSDCDGQRQRVQDLLPAEQDQLNQLILDYVQSVINPDYDPNGEWPNNLLENKYDIVAQHTNYNMDPPGQTQPWHGPTELFFSWHRDYIAGLEQYILDQGQTQFVPLPEWDITEALPGSFYNSMIPEFAIPGALISAPEPLFITPPEETWADFIEVDQSTCTEFENVDEFADWMLGRHAQVHFEMGGAMRSFASTAGTAVFWLYHAYIDEKYYCYQQICQCPEPVAQINFDNCDVCIDLSSSVNADTYELTLVDALGNQTPVSLNSEGCITYQYLVQGSNYTLRIKAINSEMENNVDCISDEIEVNFTAPDPPSSKFNPNPCIQAEMYPQFPTYSDLTDGKIMKIINLGPDREFNFFNIVTNSGTQFSISYPLTLLTGEETYIEIPQSVQGIGSNFFSFEVDDEIVNYQYFNQ